MGVTTTNPDEENCKNGADEHGARYMTGTHDAAQIVMFWLMFFTAVITTMIAFAVSKRP